MAEPGIDAMTVSLVPACSCGIRMVCICLLLGLTQTDDHGLRIGSQGVVRRRIIAGERDDPALTSESVPIDEVLGNRSECRARIDELVAEFRL